MIKAPDKSMLLAIIYLSHILAGPRKHILYDKLLSIMVAIGNRFTYQDNY